MKRVKEIDSPLPAEFVDAMANGLSAAEPSEQLDQRLARRLEAAIRSGSKQIRVQRAADGQWLPLAPGIEVRVLHHDRGSRSVTSLWRLQPGAQLPAHDHEHADEECLVIDGDICHDDQRYFPGDYMIGVQGSRHGIISSRNGGTMLLRSSDHHLPAALLAPFAA